ncbi:unnamed protein product [Brassicogethes aeneus]|uniref:Adenylate cyclase type 10 n=1 Tax=Brassicogethes aeneus TaxID=1431903 RepID=A0A9P0AXQ3_BRAAE|nr:unnamed protein product [Brassicogethes aeneus]
MSVYSDIRSSRIPMRVRWNTDDGAELRKKMELLQIKKQIEILSTFLPDSIINLAREEREKGDQFSGVVLLIEITGCAHMCEKYNKNDGGGIHRLTNTLNAYLGAIIEAVYFFGGDVLHFINDGYQCIWRAQSSECLHEVIHNVIVCSIYIRNTFGGFQTEVNVPLNKLEVVSNMCQKHLKHRETLHKLRKFNDTLTDFKITESFMRNLPPRMSVTNAAHNWMTSELKPFVITPISYQVDEKLAVDYLTELREITLLYIYIVPADLKPETLIQTINDSHDIICKYVSYFLGQVVNVVIIEKGIRVLASFGFRGVKHELESRNALRSANKIANSIRSTINVVSVSISATIGFLYCGVLGHPHRREYCLIGKSIRKSWKYLTLYPNQIVCDYLTFKNSKLSSSYFFTLTPNQNILNEVAFRYKEECDLIYFEPSNKPLLGRNSYMDFINLLVHQPHKIGHVCGVCFKGPHDIGVSKILKTALTKYGNGDGYTVGAVELIGKQRPYYTVSVIYSQIYNKYAEVDSPYFSVIKDMPRELWNFNEIVQRDGKLSAKVYSERKYKIFDLFKAICKGDSTTITILFIDNVQYIDKKSFEVIHAAMDEKVVRLVCGGCFEQSNWDTLWKFSLSSLIKVMEVNPLQELYVAPLLCRMLNIKGVSKNLVSLIVKSFDGKPGYIEKSILRLLNTNCIQMQYIISEKAKNIKEIIILNEKDSDIEINKTSDISDDSAKETGEDIIPVAIFIDTITEIGNLTLDAIIFEEYSIFTEYQQLVIKTSSVLGESFTRALLMIALKDPHDQLFANTIKTLFEENILDCGSKYMNAINQEIKPLVCQCFQFDKENQQLFGLPKYAFCKFLYFKNKTLRAFAYNLVPAYQRRELHIIATEIIENQNNKCPYCSNDSSGQFIVMRKFDELADACNEGLMKTPLPKCLDKESIDDEVLKGWVRQGLVFATQNHAVKIPQRKRFDSTECFCLEMLTKVYADLVYHSKCAEHLGRIIFFQIQYGQILLTMNAAEDCIPLLTEASELCMFNSKMQYLTEDFRKITLGKIHMLLAEAHLNLDNISIAKNHIAISLRQYDSPMLSVICKVPNKILTATCLKRGNSAVRKPKMIPFVKADFGLCMNLFRAMTADIYDTIKMGYRTIEMNLMCQSFQTLIRMLPVLSSLLLIVQRIQDAVQLAVMLCGYSSKYDQWAFIGYFAFCMELSLECSFFLEPMDKILKFVHIYYMDQGKMVESNIDNKLILLIVNYYLKNGQVIESRKWMLLYRDLFDDEFNYISITNLLKRFENELLSIIMCLVYKFTGREDHENVAVILNKQCSIASSKWRRFKPRYLHLKAYYMLVRRSSFSWKMLLKKALHEARLQKNILEQSWIIINRGSWKFSLGTESKELKEFSWTLASQYSPLHWAQIMKPLPIL